MTETHGVTVFAAPFQMPEVTVSTEPPPENSNISAMMLKVGSRPTEMGFEVTVHTNAVNLTVEMDMDFEPEYTMALLQCMPAIIENQMEKHTGDES